MGKRIQQKNKKASGIDFDRVQFNAVRNKTTEQQIKYFGGGHSGKARKALLDSGVITNDEQLNMLYKRNSKGKRVLKTLKELEDDGIMTVRKSTLDHTTKGSFSKLKNPGKPAGGNNGGKPAGGLHSQSSIEALNKTEFKSHIEKTLYNGVRVGSIEGHKSNKKRYSPKDKVLGQTWFPESWSNEDILTAATAVINDPKTEKNGSTYKGIYKKVKIIIQQNNPGTIYPDSNQ